MCCAFWIFEILSSWIEWAEELCRKNPFWLLSILESGSLYSLTNFCMRNVSVGFCNSVLPICMRRRYVWLLSTECTHEYSETKYEGKDQCLCFVPKAQTSHRCLDPYSRSGCCLIMHPPFLVTVGLKLGSIIMLLHMQLLTFAIMVYYMCSYKISWFGQ